VHQYDFEIGAFSKQDEIESRKEGLISDVEARLRQRIKTKELFAIHWQMV
jgi:hypothetical protein